MSVSYDKKTYHTDVLFIITNMLVIVDNISLGDADKPLSTFSRTYWSIQHFGSYRISVVITSMIFLATALLVIIDDEIVTC